ncbi:MAG: hypothetical protein GC160_10230 [Acidobacteria bacterium]|nr:hypothetical protein [Acidobacteriota bacterium]
MLFRVLLLAVVCLLTPILPAQEPCSIERIAGGGSVLTGVGGPAVAAEILGAMDARVGPDGLLYIADQAQDVIWRVLGDGSIEVFAGTGLRGSAGDGGPAKSALLNGPTKLTFGPDGSLYVFVAGDFRIRRIAPDGMIHAFAGSGAGLSSQSYYQPGMTAAELPLPANAAIAAGPAGEVYATLALQHRVVRIDLDGTVTPLAGRSESFGDDGPIGTPGPAVDAYLGDPRAVAVDAAGNVYIADQGYDGIFRVNLDGSLETVAGPDPLRLFELRSLDVDDQARLYFPSAAAVHRLTPGAGSAEYFADSSVPFSVFSIGPSGEIYSVRPQTIQRVDPAGPTIEVAAGVGSSGGFGEGGPAANARFVGIGGLAVGPLGDVYVVDRDLQRVRVIRPGGLLERFAGSGQSGFSGDGGPAVDAALNRPEDVAVNADGTVYITDYFNHRVRSVEGAVIRTFAGQGASLCNDDPFSGCGNGGPAVDATVPRPARIAATPDGAIYVQDTNSQRTPRTWMRRISAAGLIEAVERVFPFGVGNMDTPAIAVDPAGRLLAFVRQSGDQAYYFFDPPAAPAPAAELSAYLPYSSSMAFDSGDVLYVADGLTLRRSVPGQSNIVFTADGAPGSESAALLVTDSTRVADLAIGPDDDVYFTDSGNQAVFRLHDPQACALPALPEVAIGGIRHGATFAGPVFSSAPVAVAPGEILAIFGRHLGPQTLAGAALQDGRLTTEIAGVRVLIDGRPAPMIFASAGQLAAIVPYDADSIPFGPSLQVEVDGVLAEPRELSLTDAAPGIFTLDSSGSGPGAILNQDGSLNTADNPAKPGSIVVLWATGEGQTNPPGVDGLVAGDVLPQPLAAVSAQLQGVNAEVLYAGAAPGLTAGVMQVNLRVPPDFSAKGPIPVTIRVGSQYSPAGVTVFVGP